MATVAALRTSAHGLVSCDTASVKTLIICSFLIQVDVGLPVLAGVVVVQDLCWNAAVIQPLRV